jgi:spermidine synthase
VKPWELLGEARTPDGSLMALMRRDREHVILADGKPLMSSLMHGSEEALATLACERARAMARAAVLVGGLGMGFTLRATLDSLPPDAEVVVCELLPAVVEWNRGALAPLAGDPLKDRRVTVVLEDVGDLVKKSSGRFDTMILDVDNGPSAFTESANARLYTDDGLTAARAALRPAGVLAIWSAWDDRKFEQRLRYNGFHVEVRRVRARLKKGGPRHTIFLAHKTEERSVRTRG